MRDRTTGRRMSPWKSPNITTSRKILKNTENTWESLPASRMKASKVEKPPLSTATPMSTMAALARSFLEPDTVRKAWQMWTLKNLKDRNFSRP